MKNCLPLLLALVAMLVACQSPRPATQVLVLIDGQTRVRDEAAALELVVRSNGPEESPTEIYTMPYEAPLAWPYDVTLVPLGGDASRVFEVEATARDDAGTVLTVARLRGAFVEGASRSLRLTLEDRCIGVVCGRGFTCRQGACTELVVPDADAGTELDAGVPDASVGPCDEDRDCDDGVYCNGAEVCRAGVCEPGVRVPCDDHIACTEDVCEGTGCVSIPRSERCTLGAGGRCETDSGCQYDVCDATTCTAGPCQTASCEPQADGTTRCVRQSRCDATQVCCGEACVPAGCSDGNPCTIDTCNEGTSTCASVPDVGRACSDGDGCTTPDTCSASGACTPGPARTCDDAQSCTRDSCNPATGLCQFVGDDASTCSDGNACTTGERCVGGMCSGGVLSCDDGIACTVDACGPTGCTHTASDAACGVGGVCTAASGGCVYPGACNTSTNCAPTPGSCESTECRGDVCVRTSACGAGQLCCGGFCLSCDDGNPCTDDECSGTTCGHPANTDDCSDGSACTMGDACAGGRCVPGPAVTCDDGNACTLNQCDPALGCRFPPSSDDAACTDGNACTAGDRCVAGSCVGGSAVTCTSGPCLTSSCNPASGCVTVPREDGSDCGTDLNLCVEATCTSGICVRNNYCTGLNVCCGDGRCDRIGNCF